MKRILFVDDDMSVLEGLRLRLRPEQHRWRMTFVDNGAQAIIELQRNPCDVVVSDIRMPGMHGARFLRAVAERWPQTARIALSGFPDEEFAHVVPIAHRLLRKPCERPELEDVIERCIGLQDLLPQSALRAMIGRAHRLSPVRKTYQRLQSLLRKETATVHDIATLIAADTVLAVRLLQAAGSSFFPAKPSTDVRAAVEGMGLARVRDLMLSPEVFAQWPLKSTAAVIDLEALQQHVETIAKVARALTASTSLADDTVLAARLHGIGYWVLAQESPRELAHAVEYARCHQVPMPEAEREVVGASHAQIGAYLLGLWGLPQPIVEAVAQHHTNEVQPAREWSPSSALAVAIALSGGDDAEAIHAAGLVVNHVGPRFLESVRAPFDWSEASRRAAASLR